MQCSGKGRLWHPHRAHTSQSHQPPQNGATRMWNSTTGQAEKPTDADSISGTWHGTKIGVQSYSPDKEALSPEVACDSPSGKAWCHKNRARRQHRWVMRDESNVKRSDEAGEPLQAKTSVDIASRLAKDSILCALAGETTMRRMRHVLATCPIHLSRKALATVA